MENQPLWLKNRGQITIIQLLIAAGAAAVGLIGVYGASARYTNDQIINVSDMVSLDAQRVAKLEEAVQTIKDDNKIIKNDIKEILKAINKI